MCFVTPKKRKVQHKDQVLYTGFYEDERKHIQIFATKALRQRAMVHNEQGLLVEFPSSRLEMTFNLASR